ncbi:hypothetical protein J6590_007530 [Homalodisca vitripennis]|nr:hypothetical protein J6590_007530 [Homalodisca vitripennis]
MGRGKSIRLYPSVTAHHVTSTGRWRSTFWARFSRVDDISTGFEPALSVTQIQMLTSQTSRPSIPLIFVALCSQRHTCCICVIITLLVTVGIFRALLAEDDKGYKLVLPLV